MVAARLVNGSLSFKLKFLMVVTMAAGLLVLAPSAQSQAPPRQCTPLIGGELCLEKSVSPNLAFVGETSTFTLTLSNLTPTARIEGITDILPEGVGFVSAAASPSPTMMPCQFIPPNRVDCVMGPIPPGGTATATILVIPTQPGTFTNTAALLGFTGFIVEAPFTVLLPATTPTQPSEAIATAGGTMARAGGS